VLERKVNERFTARSVAVQSEDAKPLPHTFQTMIAFLKRRWILLLCAVLLFGCSAIDLEYGAWHPGVGTWELGGARLYGVSDGAFVLADVASISGLGLRGSRLKSAVHRPRFGRYPNLSARSIDDLDITIPIWLPLSAVFGWIVVREARWREKRMKAFALTPTPCSLY